MSLSLGLSVRLQQDRCRMQMQYGCHGMVWYGCRCRPCRRCCSPSHMEFDSVWYYYLNKVHYLIMATTGINRCGKIRNERVTEGTSLLPTPTLPSASHRRQNVIIAFVIVALVCATSIVLLLLHTVDGDGAPPSKINYEANANSKTLSSSKIRHDIVEHHQVEKVHVNMPTPILYLSDKHQQDTQLSSLRWGILGLGMHVICSCGSVHLHHVPFFNVSCCFCFRSPSSTPNPLILLQRRTNSTRFHIHINRFRVQYHCRSISNIVTPDHRHCPRQQIG